ncbi:hypothetical protein FQA39_LY02278 [Lamprigera yunnana]|nr:hypothetical protein FQA39_LY02278 [Lamprigera yunnana]
MVPFQSQICHITEILQKVFKIRGPINRSKDFMKWFEDTYSSEWMYVDRNQNLPKLPVPSLQQTLKKYEKTMEVILTPDQQLRLKQITKQFLEDEKLGSRLQEYLLNRRENFKNWAYEYWLNDFYLSNQLPLPINSSPSSVITSCTHLEDVSQVAARVIKTAALLESLLEYNIFPKTQFHNKFTLCTSQYYKLFRTCRIPGKISDHCYVSSDKRDTNVIVIHRNNFYCIPIKGTSNTIDEDRLYNQLKLIISDERQSPPVGILTTLRREEWWDVRRRLMKNLINEHSLKLIENSLLVICIDEPICKNLNEILDEDERILVQLKETLYGGNYNIRNRFYDKTTQIILSNNLCGYCFEHSFLDGTVTTTVVDLLLKDVLKIPKHRKKAINEEPILEPKRLEWYLTEQDYESIAVAERKFKKFTDDLDLIVYSFRKYGRSFMKSKKCSPDGFVQLTLQLTYFKLHGKLCCVYESASTRRFLEGRVDCIRSATSEVLDWSKVMVNSTANSNLKLSLWQKAISAQVQETQDVILGQGIDVHLVGLREAAKELNLPYLPELFTDKSYSIANQFVISSSQTGNFKNILWGFGPTTTNGYGVHYGIQSDRIVFTISSLHSCEDTCSEKFKLALSESLYDIEKMFEEINC